MPDPSSDGSKPGGGRASDSGDMPFTPVKRPVTRSVPAAPTRRGAEPPRTPSSRATAKTAGPKPAVSKPATDAQSEAKGTPKTAASTPAAKKPARRKPVAAKQTTAASGATPRVAKGRGPAKRPAVARKRPAASVSAATGSAPRAPRAPRRPATARATSVPPSATTVRTTRTGRGAGRGGEGPDLVEVQVTETAAGSWLRSVRLSGFSILVLGLIVLFLVVLAPSLKILMEQRQQIADLEASVTSQKAQVADLTTQRARWDDPAYIKAQARDRLFYVMPGEYSYLIIDDDSPASTTSAEATDAAQKAARVDWAGTLWSSYLIAGLTTDPDPNTDADPAPGVDPTSAGG